MNTILPMYKKKFEINSMVYSMLQVKTCQLASTTQFANCIRYLNLLTTIENLHAIYFKIHHPSVCSYKY